MSVLSFVGGLFKGMSVIFLCFAWPVREVEYYKQMMAKMFDVCETQEEMEKAFKLDPINNARQRINPTSIKK